jgi:hypothetical protein
MDMGQKERRVERVQFETDRQRIVGDVTLPPEGYHSRFSDSLNRVDVTFIPLVNAEVSSLMGGDVEVLPFMVVSKSHVRVAFPPGGRCTAPPRLIVWSPPRSAYAVAPRRLRSLCA